MIIYLYDGSFEGLLTAIYQAYYQKQKPDQILHQQEFEPSLFCQPIFIETDPVKFKKVYRAIVEKISTNALNNVFNAFLSETQGVGTLIYHYLRLGWQKGGEIDGRLSDRRVMEIQRLVQKVVGERHRMLGLLRFKELKGGLYYASFEPDYNIVALMAPHFTKRLSDQNWIIHDLKRKLAALYNRQEWLVTPLDPPREVFLEENESFFQDLWCQYFSSVAISSRINPRLQRQYMPVRYWRHLIEKGSENKKA